MSKKIIILISIIIICIILMAFLFFFVKRKKENNINNNTEISNNNIEIYNENVLKQDENKQEKEKDNGILELIEDLSLEDTDGRKTNYTFKYKNETYKAIYTKDNWHIEDSYKIRNKEDMAIICQALTNIHKIHGKDMSSYRTIDDLVYEWEQHNIAYDVLPEDSIWKESAKNVDLDPEDQGRSIQEIYEARTGKKFNLEDIIKENIKK